MFLSITTTHEPATDLGYLLHKNPDNVHQVSMSFGDVHMFFPEASRERCTFALILDVDQVRLVRGHAGSRQSGMLDQYVNDRTYAASSLMSVAISRALGSALGGRSRDRQALADVAVPLEATVTPLPCRGGADIVERLFAPLGYAVETTPHVLDDNQPEWGDGPYLTVMLAHEIRLADLLTHLYVLIPVLDDAKHYWIGKDEVEKLLGKGGDWLAAHPDRELITRRYLRHRGHLTRQALARLADNEAEDPDADISANAEAEDALEKPIRLNDVRMDTVVQALVETGARAVADLGCGEGKLLTQLMRNKQFERVCGLDVSVRALEIASRRLKIDQMTPRQKERIELMHGALTYNDARLKEFDAAAVIEVIEHLDLDRLEAFERALFGYARPGSVVLTTPHAEYNAKFENLPKDKFRHADHRFEWTRREFESWSTGVAERNGYRVRFAPIGDVDESLGAPTQMAVFEQ
jgi:3' terminal RNA ribose 2'-O-methyltransferase Hen1